MSRLPGRRAQALIGALQLAPHPEGGWYREIFRGDGLVLPVDAVGAVGAVEFRGDTR